MADWSRFGAGGVVWEDVTDLVGGQLGEFDTPCPVCGPERKSPANRTRKVLRLWRSEHDFASYNCARCGIRGWVTPDTGPAPRPRGAISRAFAPAPLPKPADEERERMRRVAFAEFAYFSADAIEDTPAQTYLQGRGLQPGAQLRFSRFVPFSYDGDRTGPAMVAAVRDPAGAIVGAHVTHLEGVKKLRRTCFGRISGGAVKLAEIGSDGVLAVGEGIETSLAFSTLYGVPAWACLSATGLEAFEPPKGLTRLIVAADNDESGRGLQAAQVLAKRIAGACEVVISAPAKIGDWNDLLLSDARCAA